MATPSTRKRVSADTPPGKSVRMSLSLAKDTHVRLAAAAAMASVDKNAFVVALLVENLKGVVVIDRKAKSKSPGGADLATEVVSGDSDDEV